MVNEVNAMYESGGGNDELDDWRKCEWAYKTKV